jgi:hypothetical protein
MFVEESIWIKEVLEKVGDIDGVNAIDIGSADLFTRTRQQPHIQQNLYDPLEKRNIKIFSTDKRNEPGVDYCINLCQDELLSNTIEAKFGLVIAANVLEHLYNRENAIKNILSLIDLNKGYLLVTVPNNYFWHDEDDTMYRPTVESLLSFIGQYASFDVLNKKLLRINDIRYYVMPYYYNKILHHIPLFPMRKIYRWLIPSMRWRVSCVLLKVKNIK